MEDESGETPPRMGGSRTGALLQHQLERAGADAPCGYSHEARVSPNSGVSLGRIIVSLCKLFLLVSATSVQNFRECGHEPVNMLSNAIPLLIRQTKVPNTSSTNELFVCKLWW